MKKTQTTIALAAAGVLAVGLLGYKAYSSGSLALPASIMAMMPGGAKPAPLKREFPSHAAGPAMESHGEGEPVAADESPAARTDASAGTPGSAGQVAPGVASAPAGGLPVGLTEDVESRIARAAEVTKMLMAESAKPAQPATSSSASKSAAQGVAVYAGDWTGDYLGPDSGTVSVTVEPDGSVHGQGLSAITSIGFNLVGKVSGTGQVELTKQAAGMTSTGGVFHGSMSNTGQAKGTWSIPAFDMDGTWQLHARTAQ